MLERGKQEEDRKEESIGVEKKTWWLRKCGKQESVKQVDRKNAGRRWLGLRTKRRRTINDGKEKTGRGHEEESIGQRTKTRRTKRVNSRKEWIQVNTGRGRWLGLWRKMRRTRKCSSKTKWRRMTRRVRVSFKRMLLVHIRGWIPMAVDWKSREP